MSGGITTGSSEGRYGLAGLLDVIRMTDRDLSTLALGADLTTFGLNLNSADCLYTSFTSPFAESNAHNEPQFTTPPCYLMPPPNFKPEHLSKFQIETLFYMFYSMPRDILQAFSSQELYRRDWRYHAELRIWLKQRSPQEMMQGHPGVQFVYFDVNTWEARLFTTPFRGNIAAGLLTEEQLTSNP
jgi:CCR4-NOT transcription complex subunit 2